MGTDGINFYAEGDYLKHNPSWHIEDSDWKAIEVSRIIERNKLDFESIAEIGCGAGEILNQLKNKYSETEFFGFEISPDAFELCQERQKPGLTYYLEDLLHPSNKSHFDILLTMDVIEHVEDYFGFLRQSKTKAKFKILHIPLEMNAMSILRYDLIIGRNRKLVGHIQYFSKETALETLKDCGYEIIDWHFTHGYVYNPTLKSKLFRPIRKCLNLLFGKSLAARLFGGVSLMVLTK